MATYQDLVNAQNQAQAINMVTATPQSALQNQFMNTPGYQLQYGDSLFSKSMDPSQRFMADPGTQMAIQAGMQPLMNNYAGRGLGQSGALAQGLSQYMYNNYGNFVGGQSNAFKNYQDQLMALTNLGTQNNGAAQANSNGQTIAQLVSQAAQSMGNAQLQTGENLSTLYGNQGVLNANAYLNTGAAQSNNLMQGMSLLAQLNTNQMASGAKTQSSLFNGLGAAAGSQGLQGGQF